MIGVPNAVPMTVKDMGAPDRPKRAPRFPFKARGFKPLTDKQLEARGDGLSYSEYCNKTRPKASGPVLAGMNDDERCTFNFPEGDFDDSVDDLLRLEDVLVSLADPDLQRGSAYADPII